MDDDALVVYLLRQYRRQKEAHLDYVSSREELRRSEDWENRLDQEIRLQLAQINKLIACYQPQA